MDCSWTGNAQVLFVYQAIATCIGLEGLSFGIPFARTRNDFPRQKCSGRADRLDVLASRP